MYLIKKNFVRNVILHVLLVVPLDNKDVLHVGLNILVQVKDSAYDASHNALYAANTIYVFYAKIRGLYFKKNVA